MKLKWAVLGSGGIAQRRTIPEGIVQANNAVLTAVYDINQGVNADVAARFDAKACTNEEELLTSDADVIYIATPAVDHCEQICRAADAGKHVFCEKPLAMTLAECDQALAHCKERDVKLGIGFMMRFHAQHQEALALIKEGRLGTLVLGRAQLSCWYPPIEGAWRQDLTTGGGGSLMDMGGHCIDLLEMFLGSAVNVQCITGNLVHNYTVEDTAVVLLEFESGAKAVVDCLFNVPDTASLNRLELYGSLGSILAEGTIGQGESGHMVARLQSDSRDYEADQSRDAQGGEMLVRPEPVNMYRAEVEAFSQAILDNTDIPVSGEDGRHSQVILKACYESAVIGRRIDLIF